MTTMTILDTKAKELADIWDMEMIAEIDGVGSKVLDKDGTKKYTLADAIRDGAKVSEQANGWGDGQKACALHAAVIAARALNKL